MTEIQIPAGAQVCDCCSSWTDVPVTRATVLADWGWVEGDDEDGAYLYCSECA